MVNRDLSFFETLSGVKIVHGNRDQSFSRYAYDSRRIEGGELFLAFATEKNDGNRYIEEALRKGASGYVGQREIPGLRPEKTALIVEDTWNFLLDGARKAMEASQAKIVALTGSCGKTTTKEMTSRFLGRGRRIFSTPGSFNSAMGVPLSILEGWKGDEEVGVFELGANGYGEIARNSRLLRPHVAALLNVHPVHVEFFRDEEGVLAAKKEILKGLREEGTALFNGDDPYTLKAAKEYSGRKILFGTGEEAEIRGRILRRDGESMDVQIRWNGKSRAFTLPFFLTSHFLNFLSAASLAIAFGEAPERIEEAVSGLVPVSHRGEIRKIRRAKVLDDSYNANADAFRMVLGDFAELPGRKIVVAGEMLELGEKSEGEHLRVAEKILEERFDGVYLVQGQAFRIYERLREDPWYRERVFYYDQAKEFKERFGRLLEEEQTVLVKGSFGTQLWKLVEESQ